MGSVIRSRVPPIGQAGHERLLDSSSPHLAHIRIMEFLFLLSLTEGLCSPSETKIVFENLFPKKLVGYNNRHQSRDNLSVRGTKKGIVTNPKTGVK